MYIDDFNRVKVNEKSGLVESMEQQTLSISKHRMGNAVHTAMIVRIFSLSLKS